ncbi:MAG TPA: zinc ribbon domain-containing protein [Pyrinomonadaceae bacterium]|nr:zinc ribbon domain-containing protein [Pyrinomonadaceae bacterium]
MSEPEIARRCVACGVSVREHALFCPQCGNPIPQHRSTTTNISAGDTMIDAPAETRADLAMTQPLTAVAPPPPAENIPAPAPVVVHRPTDHSVRGRVEHIRKVSSVMIDQAAYDPSLRFLLVAAAFFILFIVLLIASKVIG